MKFLTGTESNPKSYISTRKEGECQYGVFNGKRSDLDSNEIFAQFEHPVYSNEIFCTGQDIYEYEENRVVTSAFDNFYKDGKALRALYPKWKCFVFDVSDHENE